MKSNARHESIAFESLSGECEAVRGLFYLQANDPETVRKIRDGEYVVATGVAFLITEEGLLATCAHVIEEVGGFPGGIVWVHSAVTPVSFAARVLPEYWIGPQWLGNGFAEHPFLDGIDQRPEAFRQDVSILQIDPGSIRWNVMPHGVGGRRAPVFDRPKRGTARATLVKECRVLPLGAPGYGPGRRPFLDAWLFEWALAQPKALPGGGFFAGCLRGPQQFDAINLRSDSIRPGFSGSPLWDAERRLVVGMVVQYFSETVKDTASGTDARFILRLSQAPRSVDARLLETYRLLMDQPLLGAPSFDKHGAAWDDSDVFVEPRMRPVASFDPFLDPPRPKGTPAFSYLRGLLERAPLVFLQGVAGCGKTTLVSRLAQRCVNERWELGEQPIVPLLISAAEMVRSGSNLSSVLDCPGFQFTDTLSSSEFRWCLEENDASVMLIVDALDEVPAADQKRVLLRLASLVKPPQAWRTSEKASNGSWNAAGASTIRYGIVTSRPLVARSGIARMGFQSIEIEALDPSGVDEIVKQMFLEEADRSAFRSELAEVGWDRDEPTPLQIRLAATVYGQDGKLPPLARELVFRFLEVRIEQGTKNTKAFRSRDVPGTYRTVYQKQLAWTLEFVAAVTSAKGQEPMHLARELDLLQQRRTPAWLRDKGDFSRFVLEELPALTQLVWFDSDSSPTRVTWLHKTVLDALHARWLIRSAGDEPIEVRKLFESELEPPVEMSALGILEARKEFGVVQEVLDMWIRDGSQTAGGTSRKALQALAAGIDAGGQMRPRLAQELLRVVLAEFDQGALCRNLFYSADLPTPLKLIKRPALEKDIINAMHLRLGRRGRSARLSSALGVKQVDLGDREARLFDELKLWKKMGSGYQFIDRRTSAPAPARRPSSPQAQNGSTAGAANQALALLHSDFEVAGNITSLLVRDRNGDLIPVHLETEKFLSGLVALARADAHKDAGDLVSLVIRFLVQAR